MRRVKISVLILLASLLLVAVCAFLLATRPTLMPTGVPGDSVEFGMTVDEVRQAAGSPDWAYQDAFWHRDCIYYYYERELLGHTVSMSYQFNDMEDSLLIWLNDASKVQPDSLWLNVTYMKTDDSLKIRVPFTERIGMHKSRAMIQDAKRYKSRDELSAEDTATVYKVTASGETFDQDGFIIDFTSRLCTIKIKYIRIEPKY